MNTPAAAHKPSAATATLPLMALAATCLGGCVMFERPAAGLSCDPHLQGLRGMPTGSSPPEPPMQANDRGEVDETCRVELSTAAGQHSRFNASGFALDQQHCLALHQDNLDGLFAVSPPPPEARRMPEAAVFLLKYRFKEDQVELAMPDIAHTLHEIEEGRLQATHIEPSAYALRGNEHALRGLLAREPALFDALDAGKTFGLAHAAEPRP